MWRPLALCGVRPEFIAFPEHKSSEVILCLHKGGDVLHSKLISHIWRNFFLLTGQGAEKLVDGSGLNICAIMSLGTELAEAKVWNLAK